MTKEKTYIERLKDKKSWGYTLEFVGVHTALFIIFLNLFKSIGLLHVDVMAQHKITFFIYMMFAICSQHLLLLITDKKRYMEVYTRMV